MIGDGSGITWILGSSRSGTTWLTRMLKEQRRIVVVNETHVGHHLGVRRPLSIAWSVGAKRPGMTTLLDCLADQDDYLFAASRRDRWVPLVRSLLDATVEDAIQRSAPPDDQDVRVVIKEPSASGIAEVLFELTPEGRLVFLLRDPRDVVASWLAAYRPGGWVLREGGFELAGHGRLAFISWQADLWAHRIRAVQSVYEQLPAHRRLLVRYEDLVESPVSWLERITSFVGVAIEPEQIADSVRSQHIDNVPPDARHDQAHIRNGTTGSWRDDLSPDEKRFLCERLAPLLLQHGYAL